MHVNLILSTHPITQHSYAMKYIKHFYKSFGANKNYVISISLKSRIFLWLIILCEVKNDYYYFPQVSIPFTTTIPPICDKGDSNIQLACHNWTNPKFVNWADSNSKENYLTHIIPEMNSWNDLVHFVVWASKGSLTTMQYKWVVAITDKENDSVPNISTENLAYMKEIILNTYFGISNPLTILMLDDKSNSDNFKALKTYNIDYSTGYTSSIVLLHDDFTDPDYNTMRPTEITLEGSTLIVAGVTDPTHDFDTKMEIDIENRGVFVSGYAVELLHGLQDLLNFSVTPLITTDWGSINSKTGEWEGMVAAACRGEIDLAISSSTSNRHRAAVVDYNIHTHLNILTAFFKRYSGYPLNPLLLPFKFSLWISIGVWICVSKSLYFLFHRIICCSILFRDDEGSINPREILPWIFVPITNQGIPKPPSLLPLQALYFSELIVAVVLYSAFSGTLIAYLSLDYNPIRTIQDIINSDYDVEVVNYRVTHEDLMESSERSTKDLYWKSQKYERPHKVMENPIEEVMKGNFVYLIHHMGGYGDISKHYTPIEACKIQSIRIKDQYRKQGTFVRKGSQLRKIIDFGLLKLMEKGLIEVLKRRYLLHTPVCNEPMEFSGADIFDLQLAFSLLLCGHISSLIIMFMEKLCTTNKYIE